MISLSLFQCPIVIPIIMVIISVYLVVAPVVDNPQIEYLYVILLLLAGAVLYIPFVYMGYVFKFMEKVTTFLQVNFIKHKNLMDNYISSF